MNIHPLWFICILVRILLASLLVYNVVDRKVMLVVLGIISAGFFYRSIVGSNNEIQIAKVFWHNVRIIHGFMFLASFISLFYKKYFMSGMFVLLSLAFSILYRVYTQH